MSKKNRTTNWLKRHTKDPFVKQSQADEYRSRAAYKLKSINDKFGILKNITSVIDLGCAPGSWLQVLKEYKNISYIYGIDVLELKPLEGVRVYKHDIRDTVSVDKIFFDKNMKLDLVLSDIAPNITGISDVDQGNFSEIASTIEDFCKSRLKSGGTMIMKYFVGSAFNQTLNRLEKNFKKINVFKPESSKKKSNEIYLICMDFKG
ncbi:MAG: RlmE family RNA methyltransferase [Pseudomonadota bacterium]|nr:RlmE family RNA methyltransferase [Pseudomonadota bacterium]